MIMNLIPAVILGLIFGSFFNVVIYRTPIALEAKIKGNVVSLLKQLAWPASFCPNCKNKISWFDNIPVLSWVFLQGKCRQCRSLIKIRYCLVELITATIFSYCYFKFGFSFEAFYWIVLFSILIVLFFIDAETFFLPDFLTIPLIIWGLLGSYLGMTSITFYDSIIGGVAGFMVLYLFNLAYKLFRKIDGLGAGDFKLLSALGTLLSWTSLLPIMTLSSVLALMFVFLMSAFTRQKFQSTSIIPFGPFLILSYLFMYANSYIFKIF
jgi:leader peptidase (prepilin peptidase)/N-methyltransferase